MPWLETAMRFRTLATFSLALAAPLLSRGAAAQSTTVVYMAPGLPEGNCSDANTGSSSNAPVCTLARVQQVLASQIDPNGDGQPDSPRNVQVLIAPGTYRGQHVVWTLSMPDHSIEFRAQNDTKPRPVFDGNDDSQNFDLTAWFKAPAPACVGHRKSNLKFTGLQVQDYNMAILIDGNRNCDFNLNDKNSVRECVFKRIGVPADHPPVTCPPNTPAGTKCYPPAYAALDMVSSDQNVIEKNYFEDITTPGTQSGLHAVYLAHDSWNNVVKDNVFDNNPAFPLRVRDFSNFNRFENNTWLGPQVDPDTFAPPALVSGWHCHPTEWDCTKPTPECKVWSNHLVGNRSSGDELFSDYVTSAPDGQGCVPACAGDDCLRPGPFFDTDNVGVGSTVPVVHGFRGAQSAWHGERTRLNTTQAAQEVWVSGDFDADGRGDLLGLSEGPDGKVATELFTGKWQMPSVTGARSVLGASFWLGPQWLSGDLDGIAGDELALVYPSASNKATLWVYRKTASGFERIVSQTLDVPYGYDGAARALVGNFNGSGAIDFAVVYGEGGTAKVKVFRLSGASFTLAFEQSFTASYGSSQRWLAGNFDGTGADDLALVYSGVSAGGTSGVATVWLYKSTGAAFTRTVQQDLDASFWASQQWLAGDFDGDARDEISLVYESASQSTSWGWELSGTSFVRRVASGLNVPLASGSQWLVIDQGSIDDVMVVRPTN
jgi:hypothetical protein